MTARFLIGILAVGAVGALALQLATRESRDEVGVTREISGRWVTRDARWAGRYLEITPREIVFGRGAEGEARHPIVGVFRLPARAGRGTYAIRFRETAEEEPEGELVVTVAPGTLYLDYQPDVPWVPEK